MQYNFFTLLSVDGVEARKDPRFLELRAFFAGIFGGEAYPLGGLQTLEVLLFSFLLAYVPLTHMSHFFTKWFLYHDVRWGDEPMNAKLAGRVGEAMQLKPTWAAPHVGADGEKTWVDIASSDGSVEKDEGSSS